MRAGVREAHRARNRGIIRAVTPRIPALITLVSAVFVGCAQRRTAARIESARVERLVAPAPIEYRAAGDDTRPSLRFPKEGFLSFPIPPGPRRVFRTAVFDLNEGDGSEQLVATLDDRTASTHFAVSSLTTAGRGAWETWEFAVPESRAENRLEIRLSPRTRRPNDVVLARPTISAPAKKSPRIFILFVVDTLRKDHVSAYGYPIKTTPKLDEFFSRGTIWDNCFTNVPWTLPSHVTIFSSTLPSYHGVGERYQTIPRNLPLVGEVLSDRGYRTVAVTNGGYVEPGWGFQRGFDVYRANDDNVSKEVRGALSLLDSYAGEPVFLFLHTYQVHNYAPLPSSLRRIPRPDERFGPDWSVIPYVGLEEMVGRHGTDAVRRWMNARYDAALADTDRAFDTLITGLRQRGLSDETAVLFTSDHGEEIFDRKTPQKEAIAHFGHGDPYLFDEDLRVPMMIRVPWRTGSTGRVSATVGLTAVAPTILQALDTPLPATFRDRSLFMASGAPDGSDRTVVIRASRYDAVAARRGRWKLIRRSEAPFVAWGNGARFGILPALECFDTAADPGERSAVSCDRPETLDLHQSVQHEIGSMYPGSLVLRVVNRDIRGLTVREGRGLPHVVSFGELPGTRFWSRNDAVFGRLESGSQPVWVAIQPSIEGDSLALELFGEGRIELLRRGFPMETLAEESWQSLLWRPAGILGPGSLLFTTAPSPLGELEASSRFAMMDVARLRNLGYLSGSRSLTFPAPQKPRKGTDPFDAGAIRIERSRGPAPEPAPLPPRSLESLSPGRATAGPTQPGTAGGLITVTVNGKGFTPDDNVFVNGQLMFQKFVSSRRIDVGIPTVILESPRTLDVTVRNPLDYEVRELHAPFPVVAAGSSATPQARAVPDASR